MKIKTIIIALLSACSLIPSLQAANDGVATPKLAIWTADLGEGGKVTVAVSSIVSIAYHPFLLDGKVKVIEVTIDTVGNNSLRFYCVEDIEQTVSNMSGTSVSTPRNPLRKKDSVPPSIKFPEGVYAHTVEFQLDSPEALQKLYNSVLSAWERGSDRNIIFKASVK